MGPRPQKSSPKSLTNRIIQCSHVFHLLTIFHRYEKTLSHEAYRSCNKFRRYLLIGIIGVCGHSSDFFNWNRVFVRYCDGASFSGNGSLPTDSKVSQNSSSPYFLVSALISVGFMSVSLHLPAHLIDTKQSVR